VPFESSSLGSKALASLVAANGTPGAGLGYTATGEPIVLLTVPAGIVVAGTAFGPRRRRRDGDCPRAFGGRGLAAGGAVRLRRSSEAGAVARQRGLGAASALEEVCAAPMQGP
jgi:hypothetical protein